MQNRNIEVNCSKQGRIYLNTDQLEGFAFFSNRDSSFLSNLSFLSTIFGTGT